MYYERRPTSRRWSLSQLLSSRTGLTVVAAGILLIVCLTYNQIFYNQHSAVVTVCSKERVAKSGGGEYRVYTADHGTFVIKDMHWFGHWRTNSADTYGNLHVPNTYQLSSVGPRIGLFSKFPNITSFKRVPTDSQQLAKCNN